MVYGGESLGTYITSWAYDLAGRMTGMTYPNQEYVATTYHPQGTPVSVTGDGGDYLLSTAYDEAGRLMAQAFGNATEVLYTYYDWDEPDQGGRLAGVQAVGPTGALQDLSYTYDAVGNLLAVADAVNYETQTYAYDALNRLTSWTLAFEGEPARGGLSESYVYNEAGSLVQMGMPLSAIKAHHGVCRGSGEPGLLIYGDDQPIHAVRGTSFGDSFTYDRNGSMTGRTLADGTAQTLTYDAAGMLMGAEIVTAEGTSTATYVYDGDTPECHQGTSWGMPGFRRTRPGNQVIAAVDDDLRVYIGQHFEVRVLNGAEITDPPRLDGPRQAAALPADPCPEGSYCIFLGGIFNLNEDPTPPQGPELSWRSYYFAGGKRIAMREVNALGDPFGTVTWLLGDHLGSTSLSVSESGGVLAEAKYTPWGDQRTLAGDLPTDYTYTGQREEAALGLMYYVARW